MKLEHESDRVTTVRKQKTRVFSGRIQHVMIFVEVLVNNSFPPARRETIPSLSAKPGQEAMSLYFLPSSADLSPSITAVRG